MALSINSTLLLPADPPEISGRTISALDINGPPSYRGLLIDYLCCNTLFGTKYPAFVADWAPDGVFGGLGAPTGSVLWRGRTLPKAGLLSAQTSAEIWVYIVNGGTGSKWSMLLSCDEASSSLGFSPLTAGTFTGWWKAGELRYSDTSSQNTWVLTQISATGLAVSDVLKGITIVPSRDETTLPEVEGGYGGDASGVIAYHLDSATLTGGNAAGKDFGVHSWALKSAHASALYLWKKRLGGIIASGFRRTATGTVARFLHLVPHGVSSATFHFYAPASSGSFIEVYVDGVEVGSVQPTSALAWYTVTVSVTSGALHEFLISSPIVLDSVCGWWDDAEVTA